MTIEPSFNTVNGKYCCNKLVNGIAHPTTKTGFNTVNGKYCCNFNDAISVPLF